MTFLRPGLLPQTVGHRPSWRLFRCNPAEYSWVCLPLCSVFWSLHICHTCPLWTLTNGIGFSHFSVHHYIKITAAMKRDVVLPTCGVDSIFRAKEQYRIINPLRNGCEERSALYFPALRQRSARWKGCWCVYYCVIGVRIVLVCTNIPAVMQLEINKINYLHDLVQLEPHVSSEKKASRKPEVYTIVLANSKHLSRVSKTAWFPNVPHLLPRLRTTSARCWELLFSPFVAHLLVIYSLNVL